MNKFIFLATECVVIDRNLAHVRSFHKFNFACGYFADRAINLVCNIEPA